MRTNPTRFVHLNRILTLGIVNLALVSPALSQTTSLPLSTIEAATVGGTQQSQISSYVDHWSQRATGADSQQAARAQTKLIEPLINSRVSISFRRAYSDAMGPLFDQLEADNNIGSTLLALRIAGELGTSKSSKLILSSLDSDDAGVQIFAAGRAGRTFRTTAANGPALAANDLNLLIAKLDALASSTTDESLIGVCIQALGHGCSLPSDDFLAARAECLRAMCDAASKQLDASSSDLESRVRLSMLGSGAATNSLLQIGEDSNHEAVKAAVALGADMISIALSAVLSDSLPPVNNRALHVTLVRSGESLLYFALREHAELERRSIGNVQQTAFADLLEAGEDRDFRNAAALLLGAGSPIVTDFGFADDRFVN